MQLVELAVLVMATWRLSSLLANEPGPWLVMERVRALLGVRYNASNERYGANELGKNVLCMWCNSVPIGLALTALYLAAPKVGLAICLPLALSTGAILITMSRGLQVYYRDRR